MSREIKIRFWDKTTNTMIYPIANYESICIVNGKMKPSLSNNIVDNWNWYKREYEPLEYTGLKDVTEKEIYEGDILEDSEGKRYLIECDNYKFYSRDFYYSFQDVPDDIFGENAFECMKIIGNIYEKPELLKEG